MQVENRLFIEAADNWDLENLYQKLAQVKQISTTRKAQLSPAEKAILRGLLCGYPPNKIAVELHWTCRSLSVELSKGLYRYVETLTDRNLNTIKNWCNVARWLESAGYKISQPRHDWREAPEVSSFYGRETELVQLEQKIIQDKYHLITLLGLGGIGKTTLAVQFARQNIDEFEHIIWRSLLDAPLLEDLLPDLLRFFHHDNLPNTINEQISLLIKYLRSSRCLLIFDGLETLLGVDHLAGFYQEKYSNYSQLIKRIAEELHQSCLLLTSQDQPMNMFFVRGNKADSIQLGSLGNAAQKIFEARGLSDCNCWSKLIERYGGNPFALKLVSTTIQELFNGSVIEFLELNTALKVIVPTPFQQLLQDQYKRLSNLEKQILSTLAIDRQAINLEQLQEHFKPQISLSRLLPTLIALKKRSLIEVVSQKNQIGFTLQPLVMKYLRLCANNSGKAAEIREEI